MAEILKATRISYTLHQALSGLKAGGMGGSIIAVLQHNKKPPAFARGKLCNGMVEIVKKLDLKRQFVRQ